MAGRSSTPGRSVTSRALAVLDRQLTALTRMTDDLLDGARVVTGHLPTARRPLDLRQLVSATVRDATFDVFHRLR